MTTPPMSSSSESQVKQTDVVVVGAGPIGLSMCQALKNSGLRVDLIEVKPQSDIAKPAYDGREIAITHRTKFLMQSLNQWQQLNDEQRHHLKRASVSDGESTFAMHFDKPESVNGRPIETLGYLIANSNIRQAAYDVLQEELDNPSYLTTHFDTKISSVDTNNDFSEVVLSDGSRIRAKLLLAADSRVSFMRRALGISADMHEFGRTVLLVKCNHSISNQLTAHESFYYGKTLAVLPLGAHQSSMVITVENSKVNEILNMPEQKLAKLLEVWLNGKLGEITVAGDIYQYPLLGVHARQFYAPRSALIGDAAVGMHPVTAHGYNLGMESVAILSKLIYQAVQSGQDIGSNELLKKYSREHTSKTRPLYHGTNAIVKLYTNDSTPARIARRIGLRLGNKLQPVKYMITKQLTG